MLYAVILFCSLALRPSIATKCRRLDGSAFQTATACRLVASPMPRYGRRSMGWPLKRANTVRFAVVPMNLELGSDDNSRACAGQG